MAEKKRNRRQPSVRRGLVYFLMILAAAAILIWIMFHGGRKTPSKDEPSVVGLDRGSTFEGKASPGDVVLGVPAKGVQALQEDDGYEDEEQKNREPTKVIKIGQTQVVGSESLDFSTEQQKPGLMWLPIGLHEVSSGDPWVAMCLMDYGHYQENPSATPMYTFLNNHSKCGAKKPEGVGMGSVELVRMSSLMRSMKETNRAPLPPKGFVYHETRCGSTLVANMLASLPPSRVFSESKPPTQTIRECYAEGCSRDMMISIFRNVVALMGRRREGEQHEHLYYKFQNSKFIPEISEAFPEVPWIFVFRDPVEVMVSNLKSFSGAPCVRIPRQEKMRKAGGGQGWGKKVPLPNFGPRGQVNVPGGHLGGRARLPPRRRGLREGGDDGVVSPGIYGTVRNAVQEAVAEVGEYMHEELSSFATVSWNGFDGSGVWDEHNYNYNSSVGFQEGSEMGLSSPRWREGREGKGRRLVEKRLTKQLKLTMNMTMECADWLKSLCVSAVEGGRDFPSKALFVDYANLPDAVPEYVFPKHFAMAREVEKTVPDWEERMWKAAGSYSKGGGKTGRTFAGDIEAKHKQASPLIVEASGLEGGLYEIYHTLDGMQTWRRPNVTNGSE